MTDIAARIVALNILQDVIYKKQNLDDVFDSQVGELDTRDRAFIRMLVTTTLRRMGQINDVLHHLMSKDVPQNARSVQDILRLSVCQILFMNTPEFAAVDTAVEMVRYCKKDAFSKLVNAVLRNVCRKKENLIQGQDEAKLNTPEWLWNSWVKAYGEQEARQIALANLTEPKTYLSCKKNPEEWAQILNGTVTSTGSVQLSENAYIPDLKGFKEGAWWIQDAAAALPVLAFDDLKGKKVADLCAAPGGKTASLISHGAVVDAFDISPKRMERVKENLSRLNYSADLYVKDVNELQGQKIYDAILLDAPCSATGTIMRHPDLYFHRTLQDIQKLNSAQCRLLETAYRLLKDDGQLVYCTCSLQTQEGEDIIDQLDSLFDRQPMKNGVLHTFLTSKGDVRTFPYNQMDGFFICLLKKRCK